MLGIFERVTRIADPLAECRRRWPDLWFEDVPSATPGYTGRALVAMWTRGGERRFLSAPISVKASAAEIGEAKEQIAIAILLHDECEKERGDG